MSEQMRFKVCDTGSTFLSLSISAQKQIFKRLTEIHAVSFGLPLISLRWYQSSCHFPLIPFKAVANSSYFTLTNY